MKRYLKLQALVACALALLGTAHCGSDAGDDCENLQAEAGRAIHAAADGADRSCSVDSDCALVNYRVSCIDTCGSELTSVSNSAVDALEAQSRDADNKYCGPFERQSCNLIVPPCVLSPHVPAASCQQGQCVRTFVPR